MKLIVKNFGAIKEIEIDLSKKVYLFVGYNNTGKTYLSNLLYNIFDKKSLSDFSDSDYNQIPDDLGDEIVLDPTWVSSLLISFGKYLSEIVIPKSLKVNKSHFTVANLIIEFEYKEDELKEPDLKSGGFIGIQKKDEGEANEINIFTLNKPINSLTALITHKSQEEIYGALPNGFFDNIPRNKFERDINSVKKNIGKSLTHSILNLLIQNKETPFLLPANRIFLLENADELVSQDYARKKEMAEIFMEALDSKSLGKQSLRDLLAKKAESKHPTHIAKLIELISELRNNKDEEFIEKGNSFYDDLLQKIANIMGGQVIMTKTAPNAAWTEKFQIKTMEDTLNFYLASSSVNQLALLFQYLKYWAKQQENFLMIDEPEINLHPENQIMLVNLLLQFANVNGNKLLLTTHSPLVAETLNNYLILDKVKESNIKVNGEFDNMPYFDTNIKLNDNEVAIYSFTKDGSIIPYDFQKYSVFFKTFNQEIGKIAEIKSILTDHLYFHTNQN